MMMVCRYDPQAGAIAAAGVGYAVKKHHDKSQEEVCTFPLFLGPRTRLNTGTHSRNRTTTRVSFSKVRVVLFLDFFSIMVRYRATT
jgi:hypothetical protein